MKLDTLISPTPVASDKPAEPALRTDAITKRYGDTQVLEEFSLEVGKGEFVSLLGPSGCGKTTTLNIVSGFIRPDSGNILIDGKDVTGEPAHRRDTSVVFQNYALFPHLTVEKNICYGLKAKRLPPVEVKERLEWALRLAAIENLRNRYPAQLSGGQQQRVAVARSLVMQPGILLMDEPLSNLDAKLRSELRLELKAMQRNTHQSVLFVTHDQLEALSLSDRIVVMNKGHVEQVGQPRDVYENPRTAFVARFMGVENVFAISERGDAYATPGGLRIKSTMLAAGSNAVGIRPSSVKLSDSRVDLASSGWIEQGIVRGATYLGEGIRYEVSVGEEKVIATSPDTDALFFDGDEVFVHARPESLLALNN